MAIGTSDGEYYPSSLEGVLAALDTQGKPSGEPRNAVTDMRRDIIDEPSPVAPTQAPEHGVEVAQNQTGQPTPEVSNPPDITQEYDRLLGQPTAKQSHSPQAQEDLKDRSKPESLPSNAQPTQYMVGFSNQGDADKELKMTPQENDLYTRHLRNLLGPGGVDNEDGSRSSLFASTVGVGDKTYVIPTVRDGKILEPEAAIAAAEKEGFDRFPSYANEEEANARYSKMHDFMEKDTKNYQETKDTYNKVVNYLDNLSDMKNADKWSPKELIGHALATGMNALGMTAGGPGRPPVPENVPGVSFNMKSLLGNANDNITVSNRLGAPKGSTADDFIEWSRKGNTTDRPKSAYDQAVDSQARKPNLKLVTDNPEQQPQAGYKPSKEQIDLQRQQQAEQKAAEYKVNVGRGKGVLNDNLEEVKALIRKGNTPSEIAKRFDITPFAVRNWIKRNGKINELPDILDKLDNPD